MTKQRPKPCDCCGVLTLAPMADGDDCDPPVHVCIHCDSQLGYKAYQIAKENVKNRKPRKRMKAECTGRGFVVVTHEKYQNTPGEMTRLIQESSAVGDYDNSMDNPGSSFLWVGEDHHLDREEVAELIERMQYWLVTGRLEVDDEVDDGDS